MTTFFIVRHGETEWNKEKRLQGHLDSPLTERGREQATRLADAFAHQVFDVVLCSSSGRAIETAKILLHEKTIPMQLDERLREIYLGKWQGQLIADILASDEGAHYQAYCESPEHYMAMHTESFEQITNRALAVLQEAVHRFPNGSVLVVTHGVTIQCIIQYIKQANLADFWSNDTVEGTSVTELEVKHGVWQLKRIGCIQHLQ